MDCGVANIKKPGNAKGETGLAGVFS